MARNVTNVQKRGLLEIYIGLNLLREFANQERKWDHKNQP